MDEKQKIGFIGLGKMGPPVGLILMKSGYFLTVQDVVESAVRELVEKGASAAGTPKETAEASDVVISMIPGEPVLELISYGKDGVFKADMPGFIFIDMSTVSPAASAWLATRDGGYRSKPATFNFQIRSE